MVFAHLPQWRVIVRLAGKVGAARSEVARHQGDFIVVDESAKRRLSELGDLVGGVRLPERAHKELAGTDVINDVRVCRRRGE